MCPAACLAEHLDDEELRKLAEHIFTQLRRTGVKPDTACIYIQLAGSVRCAQPMRCRARQCTKVGALGARLGIPGRPLPTGLHQGQCSIYAFILIVSPVNSADCLNGSPVTISNTDQGTPDPEYS